MDDDALDLGSAEAVATTTLTSGPQTVALVLASIVLFVVVVVGTARIAARGRAATARWPRLEELPPAARLLFALLLSSFLVVQAVGLADVWVQTRVAHASPSEYFQYLTDARLLGTSHAHVFGYAVLYGFVGFVVSMTSLDEAKRCLVVSAALWGGMFDVASWWGMKHVSERFEWLAVATALVTSGASLVAFVLAARAVLARGDRAR